MRVISGTAKGRQLKGPPGAGTRPMTDRLKTSLFDTLVPYGIAGRACSIFTREAARSV